MSALFKWLERAFQSAEWKLSLLQILFGPGGIMVGGGLLAGWSIHATELLRDYAPASWVVGGILVAILIAAGNALRVWARERSNIIAIRQKVADASLINPLEDTFKRQRIRLTDLVPPIGNSIENRTFIDCDLLGPINAVIFPDCIFRGNRGDRNVSLVIKGDAYALTGFEFKNCTFRGCRFYLVTFMIPEPFYESFVQHGWTEIRWLTATPEPKVLGSLALPEATQEN